jgi:hypothetical protein
MPDLFDPNAPFILTGAAPPSAPEPVRFLMNDAYPDPRLLQLAGEAVTVILSGIRYARGLPTAADPERRALQQLTVATCALAAAEAETLMTLSTNGLSASAWIHLRTLGECDLRLRAYRDDTAFALRVYQSLVASQRDVARHLTDDTIVAQLDSILGAAAESSTDRRLTQGLISETQQAAALMQRHEWHAWSKWSHADIVALGHLAHRLGHAPASIRLQRQISDDGKTRFLLTRAVSFLLAIMAGIQALGVDVMPLFNDINSRFTDLAREYGILDEQQRG